MARMSNAVLDVDTASCSSHGQAVVSGIRESEAIIRDICTLNPQVWESDKVVSRMFLAMYGTVIQMNINHVRGKSPAKSCMV